MEEEKELESINIIRYIITSEKKRICRELIYALQNWRSDTELNHLYEEKRKINESFKFYKKQ